MLNIGDNYDISLPYGVDLVDIGIENNNTEKDDKKTKNDR